jgi:hypothetical protein
MTAPSSSQELLLPPLSRICPPTAISPGEQSVWAVNSPARARAPLYRTAVPSAQLHFYSATAYNKSGAAGRLRQHCPTNAQGFPTCNNPGGAFPQHC